MPFFAAQQSLFRAYDIRGDEQYFTPDFVQALGGAFVRLYQNYHTAQSVKPRSNSKLTPHTKPKETTVIVGYDVRCGSDSIAQTLATILQQRDLQVINLGLITTPMMAFWTEQYDGHGIMVTASHSAKGILGIKWLVGNVSPSAEDIQKLYQDSIPSDSIQSRSIQNGNVNDTDNSNHKTTNTFQNIDTQSSTVLSVIGLPTDTVAAPYIQAIAEVFTTIYPHQNLSTTNRRNVKKLDLTVVIDCMHGATSRIALPLFSRFCQHVIIINDTPDGSFPMGNPDPTEPNRLAELQQTVIINAADIGLAFDGDGDRLMIVDNSGKVVMPDHLLYLLAQVAITERPIPENNLAAPRVLFDIKCSHHLPKLLTQLGAIPVMSKTGSSLMRQQLQSCESRVIFAGELSGHFIFNDGYFTAYDDAMYAGLRLLHWLVYTAAPSDTFPPAVDSWGERIDTSCPHRLTDITRQLPTLVSTADHYLPLPDTAPTEYSVVQQLAEFCRYLQHLVELSIASNASDNRLATSCTPSLCTCSATRQHMTLAQAKQLLPLGTLLTCIDGVRLDFARSFGILRQSNTSHSLTVRFAGDSIADLKDVQMRFVALCRPFDKNLAEQIATIDPE